jgi:hypothetical protein
METLQERRTRRIHEILTSLTAHQMADLLVDWEFEIEGRVIEE